MIGPGFAPSPLWGEGWGEGLAALDGSLLFASLLTLDASAGRDVRPAAHLLSFASPKESRQRKGDPKSATPALRFGADLRHSVCGVRGGTRCAPRRFAQTTPASQSTNACILRCTRHPANAAPQAQPQGVENHTGHRCARPHSRPSAAMARIGFIHPSGRAEKRRAWGGHGQRSMPMLRALTCCGCLSEARQRAASSAAPPRDRASQVARSEAKGHGQWGRLFFAYFLLATQKKVSALPGAHPGQRKLVASTTKQSPTTRPTPSPSPQPSPQRGEGVKPKATRV